MAFVDGTVVNVALAALQSALGATAIDVQWVVEAYALFLAALLLVGGSLGDVYGRKKVYVAGVAMFAAASAWCGIAPDIGHLILARAVQGVGAALLVPGSLAIIRTSFDEQSRGRAIGTWSAFTAITAAVGPVLGGWLIEHVSWRWVFFINLPIAMIVVAIAIWRVPESSDRRQPMDWRGAGLVTTGLGGIVYALVESSDRGWGDLLVMGTLAVGIVSLSAFLLVEARSRTPLLPLSLFRSRDFSGANLLTLFLYSALSGALFFFPLNLIQIQGYSATAAGAASLPFIILMFLLSRWSGSLVDRFGPRPPLVIGPVIAATGFALFAVPSTGGSYWTTFFPAVTVLGLGMAVSVAPLTTTVMNAVGEAQAGVASGINNAVSRVAALLAIALLGMIMLMTFTHHFRTSLNALAIPVAERNQLMEKSLRMAAIDVPDGPSAGAIRAAIDASFVGGFRIVMMIAAGLALASALCAWLFIGRKGNGGETESVSPPAATIAHNGGKNAG